MTLLCRLSTNRLGKPIGAVSRWPVSEETIHMTSIASLIEQIARRTAAIECTGMSGPERAYLIAEICRSHQTRMPIVVILPTMKAAEIFSENLTFFLNGDPRPVLFYPQYNILPHKQLAYHNETAARRISTLFRLVNDETAPVVITCVGALMKRILPKRDLLDFAELVMVEEELQRDLFVEKLVSGGYFPSTIVEEPGDFSVRGGILDVFCPLYPNPLRLEFFGDWVDSIRIFDAASQRKLSNINEAVILPAREAIVDSERIGPIVGRIRTRAAAMELPAEKTRELVDRIRNERMFSGIESLMPVIYPEMETFFDYVPETSLFVCMEPGDLARSATEFWKQLVENYEAAREKADFCVEPLSLYAGWDTVCDTIEGNKPLSLKMLPVKKGGVTSDVPVVSRPIQVVDNSELGVALRQARDRENPLKPLLDWIHLQLSADRTVLMVCRTRSQIKRLDSLLEQHGIAPSFANDPVDLRRLRSRSGVFICRGEVDSGFVWPGELLAVITAEEIFGTTRRAAKPVGSGSPKSAGPPVSFADLKQGELVVHDDHGIGQYDGLVKLKFNGATNDFLLILYRDQDKLYLPVDRMNMIQKYMGIDGVAPVLNKMGGKSWERVKDRVKRSAEKIAGQLLKIYAARRFERGHAFGRPDEHFTDFEAAFPYEETVDQKKAIDAVLSDMAAGIPMDRLVCGDVGYGKTEVALRASFRAVSDCKQVAVLVPTTVLAEQHHRTFSERFASYPVRVASLTRFRGAKEQRDIVQQLKKGTVDIVIGTHRLLQKDVGFKDLGLLIFDEEHRFGVKHKEKLKRLHKTVDVLALTATPIPRTLHLSLSGIRDISVISTPPEQRRAIITYITEFDEAVISEAIRKELDRKGQIFFIHNNIHNIHKIARRLQELVPEVRLDIAHGRLSEDELEQTMFRFVNREIDMLVCTTIVESGLDIPAANTILINRADRMGLAQMYQLRGRVGRVDEQAFAYLFIPPESLLSKDSQKRLKVLMEHSDLGSGFQIAMSDLKIRGGGTILGASQSGHIAAVGYDMFLKLMEEAVSELKGQPVVEPLDPEINMPVSAFVPETFIPDIDQRLSAYRRLAKMTNIADISEFKAELADRFGKVPKEVGSLLAKIMLKILSRRAGIKRLDLDGGHLALHFSHRHVENPQAVFDALDSCKTEYRLTTDSVLSIRLQDGRRQSGLAQTKKILKQISQHGNA